MGELLDFLAMIGLGLLAVVLVVVAAIAGLALVESLMGRGD